MAVTSTFGVLFCPSSSLLGMGVVLPTFDGDLGFTSSSSPCSSLSPRFVPPEHSGKIVDGCELGDVSALFEGLCGELGDVFGELGELLGELGELSGELWELLGELDELSREFVELSGELDELSREFGELSGELGDLFGVV